jgi:hypothetical protein
MIYRIFLYIRMEVQKSDSIMKATIEADAVIFREVPYGEYSPASFKSRNDRAPDATIRGDEIVTLATFSKCHGQRRTSLRPAVGWLRE